MIIKDYSYKVQLGAGGDELTATHHQSPVVQSSNYYPFGLQHSTSWTRSTTLKNNRLYNAGSDYNEHTKNYETFYRQYDPAIGRFTSIDPLATKYTSTTPYKYDFNDPIALNDPLGDDPSSSSYVGAYEMMMMRANPNRGDGYLASLLENGGGRTGQGSGNHWTDKFNNPTHDFYVMSAKKFEAKWVINVTDYSDMLLEPGKFVQIGDRWRYEKMEKTGRIKNHMPNTYTPFYADVYEPAIWGNISAQQNGGDPPNDWFGRLGELFEKNYNGGVEYDGEAWYGTNFIGPGPSANPYKLKDPKNPGQFLKPKDMVDAAAQRHDYFYHLLKADGVTGALFATRVGFSDQILAKEASKAFFGYFRGDIDPITGNPISPRTRDVAFDIMVSFGLIGGVKYKF